MIGIGTSFSFLFILNFFLPTCCVSLSHKHTHSPLLLPPPLRRRRRRRRHFCRVPPARIMFDAIAPSPERSRGAPPSPNFLCEDEKGNIYVLSKKRRENGRVDATITSDRSRRAAQHAAGVASLKDVRVYSGIPSSPSSENVDEEVRTLEVSSGGQFAILVAVRKSNTKKSCRVYVVRLREEEEEEEEEEDYGHTNVENGNKSCYDILPKYFESAPSTTVLSAKFCPGSPENPLRFNKLT